MSFPPINPVAGAPLTDAPEITDAPDVFNAKALAFIAGLQTFSGGVNTFATEANALAQWMTVGRHRSAGGNVTLIKDDAGGFIDLFGGNATITIPANVFADGDRIIIARQGGAGIKTLVPATGTTLNDGTSGIALTTTVGQEAYLRVNGSNGNEFWLSQ